MKFGFDTTEVDVTERNYEPLPEGQYELQAVNAELRDTKAGTGQYVHVEFEVAKGEHVGRKVWANYNIHNASEKAQKIGRQELVSWATAAGVPNADDTDKLIGKVFSCYIGIEQNEGYSPQNRIMSYMLGTTAPKAAPKAAAGKTAAPKAAPAASKAPAAKASANPWD